MNPRRLELDYIASPRRATWLGFSVLAVSLTLAGSFAADYQDAAGELAALQPPRGQPHSEPGMERTPDQSRAGDEAKQAEEVLRRLSLPWAEVIEAVEQASTRDVSVLQMQPDARRQRLRLTALARNSSAMLEYLQRLARTSTLYDVALVSHEEQRDDPTQAIQFRVQASYRVIP